jgi:hypothetical protein
MNKPTPWEMVEGYTLAVIAGIGFWMWVAVSTAAVVARKAFNEGRADAMRTEETK